MANPAKSLLRLILNLKAPNAVGSQAAHRDFVLQSGGLLQQLQDELKAAIDSGYELGFYLDELPDWAATIFAVGANDDTSGLKSIEFGLRALSAQLDKDQPVSTGEDAAILSESIDELIALITEPEDFPQDLKFYCFEIIQVVRRDLEQFHHLGEFDLQSSIDRLIAATTYVAAAHSNSPTFRDRAKKLWENVMGAHRVGKELIAIENTTQEAISAFPFGG